MSEWNDALEEAAKLCENTSYAHHLAVQMASEIRALKRPEPVESQIGKQWQSPPRGLF